MAPQRICAVSSLHGGSITGSGCVFAVAAIGESFAPGEVPQATRRRRVGRRTHSLAEAAILRRPAAFVKVGRVGGVGPGMSVNADFAITIEIVQNHELLGQGMLVGG